MPKVNGIHHVTAITNAAKENLNFYTKILGLRLVKKSVNQDDVSAYHLFYADKKGSPGTDMTFFEWRNAGQKTETTDCIKETYFRVNGEDSLNFWKKRLDENQIENTGIISWNDTRAIFFSDHEGQELGLIDDKGADFEGEVWDKEIPADFCIRGFYAVKLHVVNLGAIKNFFKEVLNWQELGSFNNPISNQETFKFAVNENGPGHEIYVEEDAQNKNASSHAGGVHHVAFRVDDEEDLIEWVKYFDSLQISNSNIIDRYYFKSLYFRISPGILFEFATDSPGFSVDEDQNSLGEKLALPPFLENQRAEIEEGLIVERIHHSSREAKSGKVYRGDL